MITRIPGSTPTRSRAVVANGIVNAVATSPDKTPSLYAQTKRALAAIDTSLADAGTDKSRILTATVYITDFAEGGDEPRLGRMGRPRQPADARLHRRRARGPGPRRDPGDGEAALSGHPGSCKAAIRDPMAARWAWIPALRFASAGMTR